jgi:thiol-disulfide isomerase/thioredoxin
VSRLTHRAHPGAYCADPPVRAGTAAHLSRRAAGALALAVAGTLAVAGCAGGAIGQNTPQSSGQGFVSGTGTSFYKVGSRPLEPDVSGQTLTGQHLSLASYRGSIVALNFWASWCGPCRAEAPDFAALSSRLRSGGVKFLGIDVRDDPTSAAGFLRTFQISYPSLNDPGEEIAVAFSKTVPPEAIPTTLVIDRSGHIAGRIVGGASYDALKALIAKVAGQRAVTAAGASR